MSEGRGLRTTLAAIAAVITVIILSVSCIIWINKAGKAEKTAGESEAAAAAYAAALAESSAREAEAYEAVDRAEKAAAEKDMEKDNSDYAGEAVLYSEFISSDGEIRKSLTALTQDEPDLVKNYRIRVSLKNMETVDLGSGEGRRVRFAGGFNNPAKRDNAVIRINGGEGSYKGNIYIAGLKFNDKAVELSAIKDEDLFLSHGGALRSVKPAVLNGESCIACETEFIGNSDDDRVSVVFPLTGLDTSEFETVYYDLYFEGTDAEFTFITGCDFAGREESDPALDRINEAFAVYRSKAAAGQETKEAEENVTAAIADMRKELSRFPETDPLVIKINEALDMKEALVKGESVDSGEAASGEEKKQESGEKPADNDEKKTGVTPAVSVQSGADNEGTGNTLSVFITILLLLLALAMIVFLSITGFSSIRRERDLETVRRVREDKDRLRDEENLRLRKDLIASEEKISEQSKRIEVLEAEAVPAIDTADLRNSIDLILEKITTAENSFGAISEALSAMDTERADADALENAANILKDLDRSGESLGGSIDEIRAQLDETNESVKDINKAATIIADVASETNLLSLNASIEAARAGEAGRGFAVVAGEISRLAEQTERSVAEISDTVDKLNSDFEKTHKLMEGLNGYAAGQRESLSATRESFAEAKEHMKKETGSKTDIVKEIAGCRQELIELKELSEELVRFL